jgi:hypothetical protein
MKLYDELVERFGEQGCDRVYKMFHEIIGNLYAAEGYNPETGDECEEVPSDVRAIYKIEGKTWRDRGCGVLGGSDE